MDNQASIVHLGGWRDYDYGKVRGHRITLTYESGRFLNTILVMLVAFAGTRGWKFVRFLLHQISGAGSTKRPLPPRLREQQVVLCNTQTAGGTFWRLFRVPRNKGTGGSGGGRTAMSWFLITAALAYYALFIALGIVTTYVDVGTTVLSRYTDSCGMWFPKGTFTEGAEVHEMITTDNMDMASTYQEMLSNTTADAEAYVQNCVTSRSAKSPSSGCDTLLTFPIPYTTEEASCEFPEWVCDQRNSTTPLLMQTGNISFAQLGFNSRYSHKLHFARRTVCSPLNSSPFLYSPEQMATDPTIVMMKSSGGGKSLNSTSTIKAYSHSRMIPQKNRTIVYYDHRLSPGYELDAEKVLSGVPGDYCIPPLCPKKPAMAMSIFTLRANNVIFDRQVTDAFFPTVNLKLSKPIEGVSANMLDYFQSSWTIARPLNSVACTEMVRYCSDITGQCTDWTGWSGGDPDLPNNAAKSTLEYSETLFGPGDGARNIHRDDPSLIPLMSLVGEELGASDLYTVVHTRGASALQARRYLFSNQQARVSDRQWQIEVEGWFQTAIARLQRAPIRALRIPGLDLSKVEKMDLLDEEMYKRLCSSVKFKSPAHKTFSTAGVVTIAVGTALLTILSFLDKVLKAIRGKKLGRVQKWFDDEVLEIFREREALLQVVKEQGSDDDEQVTAIEIVSPENGQLLRNREK